MEEMIAHMRAMEARLAASEARSAAAEQVILQSLPQALAAMTENSRRRDQTPNMIDVKGLGRPYPFDGKEESFGRWATKFTNFMVVVHPFAKRVLGWAVEQEAKPQRHRD